MFLRLRVLVLVLRVVVGMILRLLDVFGLFVFGVLLLFLIGFMKLGWGFGFWLLFWMELGFLFRNVLRISFIIAASSFVIVYIIIIWKLIWLLILLLLLNNFINIIFITSIF